MVTVTLTSGANTATITGSVGYLSDYYYVATNYAVIESLDLVPNTKYSCVERCIGTLELRGVSSTDLSALETFIRTKLLYTKNSFSISAIPNTNLGMGVNTQVTTAYYGGEGSLEELRKFTPPHRYNILFKYWFKA